MIDRKTLAIIIPIVKPEGTYTIYVPDLPRERVELAVPILGHLYSEQIRLGYSHSVMVKDYEYYARQACKVHAQRWAEKSKDIDEVTDKIYSDFGNFIISAFNGATVIMPDFKTEQFPAASAKIGEESVSRAEGYFTFFYAVLRYASESLDQNGVADWTSSLPVSEYAKLLMISSSKKETSPETPTA